jgi:deoxyxylulose-5-phosphate synthase
VLYEASEQFPIGGSKTLRQSDNDVATVIGAGITLHEALKAAEQLQGENTNIRVIDLYSVKPIDTATIAKAARETRHIVVVEDHWREGGWAMPFWPRWPKRTPATSSMAMRRASRICASPRCRAPASRWSCWKTTASPPKILSPL